MSESRPVLGEGSGLNLTGLARGLARVAWVADRAPNHDLVLNSSIPWLEFEPLMRPGIRQIPTAAALDWLSQHLRSSRWRAHRRRDTAASHEILAYGYTHNNRRELDFLQGLCQRVGVQARVTNVCDWPTIKRAGLDVGLVDDVMSAANTVLAGRPAVAPGLLFQMGKFGTSVQGALQTLEPGPAAAFVVANDHAPAPVAHMVVAQAIGLPTVYVQHAEVTRIFPPLDFDLSVLRNRHSAHVYRDVGPVGGSVVVAARDVGPWKHPGDLAVARAALLVSDQADVVLYPSSILDPERFSLWAQALAGNPAVRSVAVKPHPNARAPIPVLATGTAQVLDRIPETPHVAVCGNSSITVELLERGHIVFQDFHLDGLMPDYYGFVESGVARSVSPDACRGRFWADSGESSDAVIPLLGAYLPKLCTPENVKDSLDVAPTLLAHLSRADPQAARTAAQMATIQHGLVDLPRATGEASPAVIGAAGDSEVFDALMRVPEGLALLLASRPLPQGGRCRSIIDLWWITTFLDRIAEPERNVLLDSVSAFAHQYRGDPRVKAWVRATAERLTGLPALGSGGKRTWSSKLWQIFGARWQRRRASDVDGENGATAN